MLIVLDSNVICADFEMRGVDLTNLLDTLLLTEHRVGIPEVVLAEIVNNYRRTLLDTVAALRKAVQSSRRVFPAEFVKLPSDGEMDVMVADYVDRLQTKFSQYNVVTLPYPEVAHREIVEWVLAERRPFNRDDEGYRDMLIWRTVTGSWLSDLALDGTILISNDRAAFGAGKQDMLHSDLRQDLEDAGIADDIYWYPAISDFMQDFMEPIGLSIADFMESFPEGVFELDVSRQLTEYLEKAMGGAEVDPSNLGLPPEVENAIVLTVSDIEFEEVESAELTQANKIICSASLTCAAAIVYYVFKADAYTMSSEEFAQLESNDNHHYFEGEDYRTLSIRVRFTFDLAERKIIAIDPPSHAYALRTR